MANRPLHCEIQAKNPENPSVVLSFVLCSRNDGYMGDPMTRLAIALNYLAKEALKLGRQDQIEVIVADWGSKTPIHRAVHLSPVAASMTSFLQIPPELAQKLQKDSPFSEVHPLNAAIRRAKGEYIGRIDQDTVVTGKFIKAFFDCYENRNASFLAQSFLFVARRSIPFKFVQDAPSVEDVEFFIQKLGRWTFIESHARYFWYSGVGILIMHRKLWHECGGYDERLIYYWKMEADLVTRISKKHPLVDFSNQVGYHIYHLEHFHPGQSRRKHRKLNPQWAMDDHDHDMNPNSDSWGLAQHDLRTALLPSENSVTDDCRDIFSQHAFLKLVRYLLFMIKLRPLNKLTQSLPYDCLARFKNHLLSRFN